MRQSRLYRLLGSLLVPLYAMGAWAAPALNVCPMHGSPAAAHASALSEEAEAPASHAGHAAHGASSADSDASVASAGTAVSTETAVSSTSGAEHAHGCDCIGCCAGSNGPALPVSHLAFIAPVVVESTGDVEIRNAEVAAARLAHVLPFATAPPENLV